MSSEQLGTPTHHLHVHVQYSGVLLNGDKLVATEMPQLSRDPRYHVKHCNALARTRNGIVSGKKC